MRLLVVSVYYKPAFVYGGPTRCLATLCEGLIKAGADVTVFTTDANGSSRLDVPLTTPSTVDGIPVWYFPLRHGGLGFFYAPIMARELHKQIRGFDLVITNALWGYPMHPTVSACRQHRIPYICQANGQLMPWALRQKQLKKSIYYRLFARPYLNDAAAIHCTHSSEALAVQRLQLRTPPFVVPNAVDLTDFSQTLPRGQTRRSLGISADALVLLFLGRLTRIKRPDIAVEVLAVARQRGLETHLIIAGPDQDGLTPGLREQAKRLGCGDHVHFTGLMQEDAVRMTLQDVDLLLMPTEVQENFGMSALEAMAAGVPVLVSTLVPVGRWAEQAGAGRAVACSAEAFIQASLAMIEGIDSLKVMGERGRKLARERFDTSTVARQALDQYQAIVNTGRPLPDQLSDDHEIFG